MINWWTELTKSISNCQDWRAEVSSTGAGNVRSDLALSIKLYLVKLKKKKNFQSKLWPKRIECQGLVEIDWHPDSPEILKYRKSSIKSLAGAYLFQAHLSRGLIETRGLFVIILRNDDGISFPWRTRIRSGRANVQYVLGHAAEDQNQIRTSSW